MVSSQILSLISNCSPTIHVRVGSEIYTDSAKLFVYYANLHQIKVVIY